MNPLDYSAKGYLGTQLHTAATHGEGPIRIETDAVIVGSGPGGSVTASVFAEEGVETVVLEAGQYWPRGSFKRSQSWALEHLYQDRGTRVSRGNTFIPVASGKGVGGGSLINSGIAFRGPDRILDMWVEDHGVDIWADDRDAVFSEVERTIGVAPTPASIAGNNSLIARRGFEKMGVDHAFMPRNAPACAGCGTCQTGCPTGGKASTDLNWLPKAFRDGLQLYADTRVDEIIVEKGRAVGVRGTMRDPESDRVVATVEVRANRVILACGAINTATLLQENKLANSSGQVGQNLHTHPGTAALAKFDEEVRIWQGATQGYYAHHPDEPDILAETFSATPEAFFTQVGDPGLSSPQFFRDLKYVASCGTMIRDQSPASVGLPPMGTGPADIVYNVSDGDMRKYIIGLEFVTKMFFEAGSRTVKPLAQGAKWFSSFNEARQFIRGISDPADIMLYSSHPHGTTRIGADPAKSVVRPDDAQTHDVENLHITDSSLFPTALGANPQVTIMAQSLRLARRIAARG